MGTLAPWDALPFYNLPREFTVTDNGTTQLVIPGDPNRRVIIAHCRQGQSRNWSGFRSKPASWIEVHARFMS